MARILIADDSRTMQLVAQAHLRGDGHELIVVSDGRAALASAEQSRPDLVLSDFRMPSMDGVDLCLALKARIALRRVPVVLMSSKLEEAQVRRATNAGVAAILEKPLDPEKLRGVVARLLTAKS